MLSNSICNKEDRKNSLTFITIVMLVFVLAGEDEELHESNHSTGAEETKESQSSDGGKKGQLVVLSQFL